MDYVQNDILDYHSFQTPPGLWGLAEEQIKQLQANFSLPKLYKHYIRTIWIHTSCFQLELKFKTVYCHQSLNTDRYFCEPLDEILGHCSAWYVTRDVCPQGAGVGVQNPKGHGCMVPPWCLPVPVNHSPTWCDNAGILIAWNSPLLVEMPNHGVRMHTCISLHTSAWFLSHSEKFLEIQVSKTEKQKI